MTISFHKSKDERATQVLTERGSIVIYHSSSDNAFTCYLRRLSPYMKYQAFDPSSSEVLNMLGVLSEDLSSGYGEPEKSLVYHTISEINQRFM